MDQKVLPVIYSTNTLDSLETIYNYGAETFSPSIAEKFIADLIEKLDCLCISYLLHAECRFIPTKSKKYRMFPFSSYLIIYKISEEQVTILTILHKSRSIASIRTARRIKS